MLVPRRTWRAKILQRSLFSPWAGANSARAAKRVSRHARSAERGGADPDASVLGRMLIGVGRALTKTPVVSSGLAIAPIVPLQRPRGCVAVMQQGGDSFFEDSELDELEAALRQRGAGERGNSILRRSRRPPKRGQSGSVGGRRLLEEAIRNYNEWVSNPGQELLLGAFALLAGNYLAHFLDTTFGQSGFWETVVGAVTTFYCEWISRQYYMVPARQRTSTLKMLNALKTGLLFGLVLDALKLAG